MPQLEWEWTIYGHPNDRHGDDVDDNRGTFTGDRLDAMLHADEVCRRNAGYECRISVVGDGFDFYDGRKVGT